VWTDDNPNSEKEDLRKISCAAISERLHRSRGTSSPKKQSNLKAAGLFAATRYAGLGSLKKRGKRKFPRVLKRY